MSKTIFRAVFEADGVAFDPDSVVLCDSGATYGIKRLDTGAVVVPANTPFMKVETGHYQYALTDPAQGLPYQAAVLGMVGAVAYRYVYTKRGGGAGWVDLETALDPLIVPYVKAPLAVIHQKERVVLQDWCKKSEAWKYRVETVSVADQAVYDLTVPAGTHVLKFVEATIDEAPQSVLRLMPDDEAVEFSIAPSDDDSVVAVTVILGSLMSLESIPEWIRDRYGAGIAQGVLAYLHGMADTTWYSPQSVLLEMEQFLASLGEARSEVRRSRGPAEPYTVSGIRL